MRAADPVRDAAHRAMHRRLLDGDVLAPTELADAFVDPLADWLTRGHPNLDPDLCTEAAIDAIMTLIKSPHSYDPDRGTSLTGYLRMSAKGDLLNRLRKEKRHSDRRADLAVVELSPTDGKYLLDGEADPIQILIGREEIEEMLATMPRVPKVVLEGLTEQERAVLALARRKERRTSEYARVLCITDVPFAEQQQEVKRVRDRLHKRVQRAGYGHERQT